MKPRLHCQLRAMVCLGTLIGVILTGCAGGVEETFSTTPSPDGKWSLRVTVAAPRMPQSKYTIAAYVVDAGGAETRVIHTPLENDGVPFTTTNIAARWISPDTALLCLRATDLPDRGLRIETAPAPRATEVDQC